MFLTLTPTLVAAEAPAQEGRDRQQIVLMDVSDERSVVTSVDLTTLQECIPDVHQLCASDPAKLRREMACLVQNHSSRWLGSTNDTVTVYVLYGTLEGPNPGPVPRISFAEVKRRSRLESDLRTLMSVVQRTIDPSAAVEAVPGLACAMKQHTLVYRRAHLKVSVQRAKPASEPADETGEEAAVETTLRTGPKEHWFVSADVPLTQLNDVQFNENSELELAETPSRWLVALNFTPGDLAEDENNWSRNVLHNLVIKTQITLSTEPLETFGFAVGLRGRYLSSLGIDFDTITPFVGALYTRSEPNPADPSDTRLTLTWQVGISLNISKALGWISNGE